MRKFLKVDGYNGDTDMPRRKTRKSAGYDIVAPETVFIQPHKFVLIPTNIKVTVEDNEFVMIVPRSSLYKKHKLIMVNSVGVIDADYFENPDNDGNVGALLLNDSDDVQVIGKNEAFAQAIIMEYKVTDDDNANGERLGGYGSTDEQKNDNMNTNNIYHDVHYAEMNIQPIELDQKIQSHEAFVGGLYQNVVKYHLRAGHKKGEAISKEKDKRNRYISWFIHACRGEYIDPRLDYPVYDFEIEQICNEIDEKLKTYAK